MNGLSRNSGTLCNLQSALILATENQLLELRFSTLEVWYNEPLHNKVIDITTFYITKSSLQKLLYNQVLDTIEPPCNQVLGITNAVVFITPVILTHMEKNFDITKPLYSEQISPVPWAVGPSLYRGSTVWKNLDITARRQPQLDWLWCVS